MRSPGRPPLAPRQQGAPTEIQVSPSTELGDPGTTALSFGCVPRGTLSPHGDEVSDNAPSPHGA